MKKILKASHLAKISCCLIFTACFSAFFLLFPAKGAAASLTADQQAGKKEVSEASRSLGFLMGKKIKNSPIQLDQSKIFEGLKEALSSKRPTLSEQECLASLAKLEEKIQNVTAEKNLMQASLFLQRNAKDKNTVVLEKGRLQYKIIKKGAKDGAKENSSPLIRYKGELLNGEVFLPFQERLVSVAELLPGLKKAILGMKEKERRKIFIHPELGYGKENILPPNSLLIFDVELIKADKSKLAKKDREIAEKKIR